MVMMRRLGLIVWWTMVLMACTGMAQGPLDVLQYCYPETPYPKSLIVFLRGMTGTHHSFKEKGFIEAVRERNLPFDISAPNTHFAFYQARNLEARLKSEIIDPAKARGYVSIWLVGVSLGGLGALFYLKNHPEDIAGVYVIAPFLGYCRIFSEIEGAGGLSSWEPGHYASSDWQRLLWSWLKQYTQNGADTAPIYLGYGRKAAFHRSHLLLASALPR